MTQAVSTHNSSFHSVEHDRQSVPDPDRVAYFEKAGWQAYYDRKWLRVLRLMVQLNREQFGMSLLTAIAAAVDVVRASLAFAPVDNDVPAATGDGYDDLIAGARCAGRSRRHLRRSGLPPRVGRSANGPSVGPPAGSAGLVGRWKGFLLATSRRLWSTGQV